MGLLKGILFLFLLALAIGFALHNDQPVSLRYYFGWVSIPLPLFLWAFLAFLSGLITFGLYTWGVKINLRSQLRQMQKNIRDMEKRRRSTSPQPD